MPIWTKAISSTQQCKRHTFRTGDRDLDAQFAKEAAAAGLSNLKGHRLVGGMRASLYNAMPIEGVKALIDFMARFEKEHI